MIIFLFFALILMVLVAVKGKQHTNQTPPPSTSPTDFTTPTKQAPDPKPSFTEADAKRFGAEGEAHISTLLTQFQEKYVLRNAYIPTSRQGTTEVDVIIVATTGILVIESKNLSGVIKPQFNQQFWEQHLPDQTYQIPNPFHQNNHHISCLANLLSLDQSMFFSLVVFGKRGTVDTIKKGYHQRKVTHITTFLQEMKAFHKQPTLFSKAQTKEIYETLLPYCNVTEQVKAQHINHLGNKAIHNKEQ